MAPKIMYHPAQYSDVKSLLMLDDYLKEKGIEAAIGSSNWFAKEKQSLSLSLHDFTAVDDYVCVTTYGDISDHIDYMRPTLQVDAKLLHFCGGLSSWGAKMKMREELGIRSDKPVVVIGNAEPFFEEVNCIVDLIKENSYIYLLPNIRFWDQDLPKITKHRNVFPRDLYGNLADYFLAADITIRMDESYQKKITHNQSEATRGGINFCVPPSYPQFLYDELVDIGSIIPCNDIAQISQAINKKITLPLDAFNAEIETVYSKRNALIQKTRTEYLPIILDWITLMQNCPDEDELMAHPRGNLRMFNSHEDMVVRLLHPKSKYTLNDENFG